MKTASQTVAETIPGVLLPAGEYALLLPATMVHEVLYRPDVTPVFGPQPGVAGELQWHGHTLVLVDPAVLIGGHPPGACPMTHAVVTRALSGSVAAGAYAIAATGLPLPVPVTGSALAPCAGSGAHELVLNTVRIAGEDAWIVDFDALERSLARPASEPGHQARSRPD